TYIGKLSQPNGWCSSWLDYYRNQRLMTQLEYGIQNNRVTGKRRDQLEKLLSHLDEWIPKDASPSYLHGDLWGGNWLVGEDVHTFVVVLWLFYVVRHFVVLFTELVGSVSYHCCEAYRHSWSLVVDSTDRMSFYQLYYRLFHLYM